MAREFVGDHFGIAVNPVDGLAGDESVSELDPELQRRQDRRLREAQSGASVDRVVGPDWHPSPSALHIGRGERVDLGLVLSVDAANGAAAGRRQRAIFVNIDSQVGQRPPTSGSARGRAV